MPAHAPRGRARDGPRGGARRAPAQRFAYVARRMSARRLALAFALLVSSALPFAAGCSPTIGDTCGVSTDCDINGTRICDLAQPGGYCTIRGCDVGTCPDGEASCIQFRADEPRLADSFCMAVCDSDGDCRRDEGYRCVEAAEVAAVVLDGSTRFCAIPPAAP
jgi:hypothetical protein